MNGKTIITKTGKGMREASGATRILPRDLHNLLSRIDGRSSVADLVTHFTGGTLDELESHLRRLTAEGYVRELSGSAGDPQAHAAVDEESIDLDFTSQVWLSAMHAEQVRREEEEQVRLKAAETTRRLAEESNKRRVAAQAKREAEALAQRQAAERARLEAENRARQAAAELARREAEERARREAEALAQREAAERAQREAEELTRRQAADQLVRLTEAQVKRAAAQQAQQEAHELALREARQRAQQQAEDPLMLAVAKHERRESGGRPWLQSDWRPPIRPMASAPPALVARRRPIKRVPPVTWGLASLALCLLLLRLLPFDWRIPNFERAAAEQLGQPVKIGSAHLSLLPQPHWRLDDVAVGGGRQIRIPTLRMIAGIGSLFSDKPAFTAIELESPRTDAEGVAWLLFGKPDALGLANLHVDARNVAVESEHLSLPTFDVDTDVGADGRWRTIVAKSTDRKIAVELHADGTTVQVVADASALALPFAATPSLTDWHASGSASRGGLELTAFSGRLLGGRLNGSARLTWDTAMRIEGELYATRIDAAKLYPGLFAAGQFDVKAVFAVPVQDAGEQATAPRLAGKFSIERGTLASVDLGNVLKNLGTGGTTRFARLDGSFVHDGGSTQLRELHLDAGAMSASGYADVDAERKVRGAVTVVLALSGQRRRAGLDLAGTFDPPYGRNVRWLRH